MRRFVFTCFCMALVLQSQAQNLEHIVDSLFYGKDGFTHNSSLTGANVGILLNDTPHFYSYGYTDKSQKKPVDTATVFEIGGITKVFTALLMEDAIEKKALDPNILIERFVPVNTALANQIKVSDLAFGTSGLPTLNDKTAIRLLNTSDSAQPFNAVDQAYLINVATGTTALDEPGKYKNSNYAFGLLGFILAANSNMDYNTLLKQTILGPLHLNNTTTQIVTNENMAKGYADGKEMPYIQLSGLAPAGILKSTVTDLLRFTGIEMNLVDSLPLFHAMSNSQQIHYQDATGGSGAGWETRSIDGAVVYLMPGKTYGFSTVIAFDRNQHLGIVIMLNTNDESTTNEALKYIHSAIVLKPQKPVPQKAPEAPSGRKKSKR
jgi:CubicO group peptidase (beta-lactamase class C family)